MDPERVRRHQSLKIIISETIMVLAVVLMVTILALLVSGYWVNSDFKVERQGLLQVSSIPSGADVYIDGNSSWLQRTNTSKVLASGEHTITIKKDGYDSWSRTINIPEGLLYRLHYPRLFLNERNSENILNTNASMATFSPDYNSLLLINDTTIWQLVNLDNEKPSVQSVDISSVFSSVSIADGASKGLFTGVVREAAWNKDSNCILFNIQSDNGLEWVLLDIKNPARSVNITKDFGNNFDRIEILDSSANNLLAIQNSNLYKIDLNNRAMSAILVENILDFNFSNSNEVVFSALENNIGANDYYVGILKLSNGQITKALDINTSAKVGISKFYDDKYITVLEGDIVSLYRQEDFSLTKEFKLSFTPETLEIGHNGEFATMVSSAQIATLDMEAMSVTEWRTENPNFDWLDSDMIYVISSGELVVYDFNGLNRRVLSSKVSSNMPATITSNKWLYYFSDSNLMRELVAS